VAARVIEKWTENGSDVELVPFDLPPSATRAPRRVTIHYFTPHPGTSEFWRGDGARCISAIGKWLVQRAPQHDLLWSSNKEAVDLLAAAGVGGIQVQPIQTGSNQYRHLNWAAIIYSAKLTPDERTAYRLFGLSAADVRRSREFEAILQFSFRTSLREDASIADVDVVVYDKAQAEFLEGFLTKHALAATVDLSYEDVGIANLMTKGTAKKAVATPSPASTSKDRTRLYRERLRGGEPARLPGRPRKAPSS
jgi:hypothetical protein